MIAQRTTAQQIDALEIDEDAYEQCVENFENSPIVAPKGKNGKIVRVENYENFTVSVSTFMEDEFQRLSL